MTRVNSDIVLHFRYQLTKCVNARVHTDDILDKLTMTLCKEGHKSQDVAYDTCHAIHTCRSVRHYKSLYDHGKGGEEQLTVLFLAARSLPPPSPSPSDTLCSGCVTSEGVVTD